MEIKRKAYDDDMIMWWCGSGGGGGSGGSGGVDEGTKRLCGVGVGFFFIRFLHENKKPIDAEVILTNTF